MFFLVILSANVKNTKKNLQRALYLLIARIRCVGSCWWHKMGKI